MSVLMAVPVRAAAETLPTLSARVGLLACVHPQVPLQMGDEAKALPANGAVVGFLAAVGPLVREQLCPGHESLPTLLALVRLSA